VQELSLIKVWFTTWDNLIESRTAIKKEADDLQAEIGKLKASIVTRLEEANEEFSLRIVPEASLEMIQQSISDYLVLNEKAGENLAQALVQANTRLALQQYADSLDDGKPCPLCGSEHHPAVLHTDGAVSEEIKNIESQRSDLNRLELSVRQFLSPVERIFNQIESLEKQKSTIKQRWQEVKIRMDAHDQVFVWTKFDKNNRESFDKHFEEVVKNQAGIKENEVVIKSMAAKIDAEMLDKVEKIEKPLQNLRNDILKVENTIATLTDQLEKVRLSDFETQEKNIDY
jgi:exonuclease SbcC